MKRHILLIAFSAFAVPALFAQGGPAGQDCGTVCSETSNCEDPCWDCNAPYPVGGECPENYTVWMTCGDAGICDTCPSSWVETSRTRIGADMDDYFFYCDRYEHFTVRYHDLNGCEPDYTDCEFEEEGSYVKFSSEDCCELFSQACWGQTCS